MNIKPKHFRILAYATALGAVLFLLLPRHREETRREEHRLPLTLVVDSTSPGEAVVSLALIHRNPTRGEVACRGPSPEMGRGPVQPEREGEVFVVMIERSPCPEEYRAEVQLPRVEGRHVVELRAQGDSLFNRYLVEVGAAPEFKTRVTEGARGVMASGG